MARIELVPELVDDLDRILDHLGLNAAEDAPARIREIVRAVSVLEDNPLIGRLLESGHRELVIGRDARGYVALYRYVPQIDVVFVLAIRRQREAGYVRD